MQKIFAMPEVEALLTQGQWDHFRDAVAILPARHPDVMGLVAQPDPACGPHLVPVVGGITERSFPVRYFQAVVTWLKISGRSTYKDVPLTARREASTHSAPRHIRPVRVFGSMIQTVSTPIAR